MTIVTHAAFGVLVAAIAGEQTQYAVACALGASLPDIDHPQSSIGRLLFPISIPLNAYFGHRGLVHAFIVWLVPLIIALLLKQKIAAWVFIGALSHCFIDCWNVSGVKALMPFTEKVCVIFKRDWRIQTSSLQEIWVFVFLFGFIVAMGYAHSLGGPRRLINLMAHSHQITIEEYQRAGLKRCEIEGQFRWNDGTLQNVKWLVIGLEDQHVVCWDGEKLIKNDKHGRFLRSVLHESETVWPVVQIDGIAYAGQDCFWLSGKEKKWHYSKKGELIMGSVKSMAGEIPMIHTTRTE